MLKNVNIAILSMLLSILFGCVSEKDLDPIPTDSSLSGLEIPNDFDFSTSKNLNISLDVPDFLTNAVFTLYSKKGAQDSVAFTRATFNSEGHFERRIQVGADTDSIVVSSNYSGLTSTVSLPVEGDEVSFDYRPLYDRSSSETGKQQKNIAPKVSLTSKALTYTFLSGYDSKGVPDEMAFPDWITIDMFDNINASLPEGEDVNDHHPEYLTSGNTNLVVTEEADVWVTFVSEYTNKKNVFGFYTYPVGEEPASADDITEHTVVFPNASMRWSGGGLYPGDKVHIGRFPANTVISWFVAIGGWNKRNINDGDYVYYSNPEFNTNDDEESQMVLLKDPSGDFALLGIEDGRGWDKSDYNDQLFYITSDPIDAIEIIDSEDIVVAVDTDNDGVDDTLDSYPSDPNLAFNNFYPSIDTKGKLVYEDLWPNVGDYDFNDLAVDYNFNLITNANNLVKKIKAVFTISSIGGYLENGFAFVLPVAPSSISGITGQDLNASYIVVDSNGTETETAADESVVFVVGNVIGKEQEVFEIEVEFVNALAPEILGDVPFNAFLIAHGLRAQEIHLPDHAPTSKAGLLGTAHDNSDPSNNRYYKTNTNLPWALDIFEGFAPPAERVPITEAYPDFSSWANSGGILNQDWYIK